MQVISNVTGRPFGEPAEMAALLARQLVEPVQWEATLSSLLQLPASAASPLRVFELGPGQQVKAMVKRVSPDAHKVMQVVNP